MNSRWKNAMIGLFHFLLLTGRKENRDKKDMQEIRKISKKFVSSN
mgnify:CR=1 FL=1